MSLLTTGKGKKGLIESLLKEGNSDDVIVQQVGTSKSYVQKVKSQLKSTKGMTPASDVEQDESVGDKRVLETDKETTILPEHNPSSTSEEKKPLTKNDRQKIYNLFFKGWKPSKIVAKIGYPYDVVEAEYRNFRRDSEFDMQTFQKAFMSENGEDIENIGSEGEAFVKRYKRDGFLLNDDFSKLIQLKQDTDKEEAINDVLEGEVSAPEGWTSVPCNTCGKPMDGALVDAHDGLGKHIIQVCDEDGWGHSECHEKQDAIEAKKG